MHKHRCAQLGHCPSRGALVSGVVYIVACQRGGVSSKKHGPTTGPVLLRLAVGEPGMSQYSNTVTVYTIGSKPICIAPEIGLCHTFFYYIEFKVTS